MRRRTLEDWMPAVELSDKELEELAGLALESGNELLARKLTAQTFAARGLRRPEVRNVTWVPTPPDAA